MFRRSHTFRLGAVWALALFASVSTLAFTHEYVSHGHHAGSSHAHHETEDAGGTALMPGRSADYDAHCDVCEALARTVSFAALERAPFVVLRVVDDGTVAAVAIAPSVRTSRTLTCRGPPARS